MTDGAGSERRMGLLPGLGFVRVGGDDATAFLQSMLSADIEGLEDESNTLAGWHDRNGRALACPRVVRKPQQYWLVLPRELTTTLIESMARFVLRSKVVLSDASDELAAAGVYSGRARYEIYAPAEALAARVAAHRDEGVQPLDPMDWELADIRDGLPAVYAATSGQFTAQMLNLDLVGGVSFKKGCYPGQEIIARTHHLGKAKRRMQRYCGDGPAGEPGDAVRDAEGRRAGTIVRTANTSTGSESLVVSAIANTGPLTTASGISLTAATLPYAVGEAPG